MDKIELQVAFGAVKHFGRNLYTSNPPALAELVANSWDAYATKCEIIEKDNQLLIADNGIGMTDDELIYNYAVSGVEKKSDSIRKPSTLLEREYMGRKGIGKFSAFSLGEEYIIYTKSNLDQKWKKMSFSYEELLVNKPTIEIPVDYVEHLDEIETNFLCDLNFQTGTIIIIPNLRRKFIKSSSENTKNILSRRFSVTISKNYQFNLLINNESIDLKKHFYDNNIEFVHYFNMNEEFVRERFPNVDTLRHEENAFFQKNNISGWLGTVKTPQDLKVENELNSNGIVIYINGKLADENILRSSQNARMSNSYVVGEVDANFLQDSSQDPVLSSREGLNLELDAVVNLKEQLNLIRDNLVNQWNDYRASREIDKQDYLKKILSNSQYQQFYSGYTPAQQKRFNKYVQSIFDNPTEEYDEEKDIFTPVLFTLINSEIISDLEINPDDDYEKALIKFFNLFEKAEINDALRIKSNIQDRLNVIEELQKHVDENAKEKVFENHLEKHPWLVNPFWDRASKNLIISTQDHYKQIIDNTEKSGFTDIIIRAAEEPMPIICELKRSSKTSYSKFRDFASINSQITAYRKAIYDKEVQEKPSLANYHIYSIKAYFICGNHVLSDMDPNDRTILENNKITILTYDQIITGAKALYRTALEKD